MPGGDLLQLPVVVVVELHAELEGARLAGDGVGKVLGVERVAEQHHHLLEACRVGLPLLGEHARPRVRQSVPAEEVVEADRAAAIRVHRLEG